MVLIYYQRVIMNIFLDFCQTNSVSIIHKAKCKEIIKEQNPKEN